jgi:hypothetical protein
MYTNMQYLNLDTRFRLTLDHHLSSSPVMVSTRAKLAAGPLRSIMTTGVALSAVVQVSVMTCPASSVAGVETNAIALLRVDNALFETRVLQRFWKLFRGISQVY